MDTRTWTVVKFLENGEDEATVEAVPSSWIVGNECLWPSFTGLQLQKSIKNHDSPQDDWKTYKISNFRNSTSSNYAIARLKATRAEVDSSDLSSDTEAGKKRKITRKIYSSDEENDEPYSLPNPPTLKKGKQAASTSKDSLNNQEYTQAGAKSITPVSLSKRGAHSSKGLSDSSNVEPCYDDTSSVDNKTLMPCTCCVVHVREANEHYKQIIRKQNILQAMISQVMEDIRLSKETPNEPDVGISIFQKFDLPLRHQDALNEIEEYLSNEIDFAKAVEELSRTGGAHVYDFVKRVMSKLMNNEFAADFSWLGLKKKQIFGKLRICQLIVDAGMKHQNCTSKQLEDAIKNWLRRAKERATSENKKVIVLN